MDCVVDPTEFAISWFIMLNVVSLTCTALVLYGLYVVLFVIAIRALRQRNLPRRRDLIVTTLVMFFLGACGAVVNITMAGVTIRIIKELVRGASLSDLSRLTGKFFVLQLTDVRLAGGAEDDTSGSVVRHHPLMASGQEAEKGDGRDLEILQFAFETWVRNRYQEQLYRCYIIWGSKKKVLILPALCSLATVAGRIWYKGRETQIVLGPTFRKKYNTAAALVLESGALYCFCLIPWAASQFIMSQSEWIWTFTEHSTNLDPCSRWTGPGPYSRNYPLFRPSAIWRHYKVPSPRQP
ncbi:hypothetical protein B0H13DRAFT_1863427 [Mycena leptocephala]|nr:hypothetical protein B0H13DRAFT_1863427 [Mycena leptocephala]